MNRIAKFEFGMKYFGTRLAKIYASEGSCDHIDIQCNDFLPGDSISFESFFKASAIRVKHFNDYARNSDKDLL